MQFDFFKSYGNKWAGPFVVPDFRRLWIAGLVVFTVRWLETLAMAVFAYQKTGSPFIVAMLTMVRVVPIGLTGGFIAAMADRIERRISLLGITGFCWAWSLVMAWLAQTGRLEMWHLGVGAFINGISWAADNPVRRVMVGDVVGPDRMGQAMSIDIGANYTSRMLGPALGGFLLATYGIQGAFYMNAACYTLSLFAVFGVKYRNNKEVRVEGKLLSRVVEGVRIGSKTKGASAVLIVSFLYNLFGYPFNSMIPVIAQANFHLDEKAVGLLASVDGVGSLVGSLFIALYVKRDWHLRTFLIGTTFYLLAISAYAISPNPWLAAVALFVSGVANSGFAVMQATILYLAAPPAFKSHIYGALSLAIGISPVGFTMLGFFATQLGPTTATFAMGLEGLVAIFLAHYLWRNKPDMWYEAGAGAAPAKEPAAKN